MVVFHTQAHDFSKVPLFEYGFNYFARRTFYSVLIRSRRLVVFCYDNQAYVMGRGILVLITQV